MNVLTWAASVLAPRAGIPGAIDIVAIQHTNGRIECSPFHVKFSVPLSIDSSKLVQLRVNGDLVNVQMKLGPAGEAFFVERTENYEGFAKMKPSVEERIIEKREVTRHRSLSDGHLESHEISNSHEIIYNSDLTLGTRMRSRSDLSDLTTANSPLKLGEDPPTEDWTWKWGKMPVKSNSHGSNLHFNQIGTDAPSEEIVACRAPSGSPVDSLVMGNVPEAVADNIDRDDSFDVGSGIIIADDDGLIEYSTESLLLSPAIQLDNTCQTGPDRAYAAQSEGRLSARLNSTFNLKDVPYDAISPEPAAGDFYDSDTDSYLSFSLDDGEPGDIRRFKYRKLLVPSQEQLQQLQLRVGENEICFELEGCTSIFAQLFVWAAASKLVVVDIEGAVTVTRRTQGMFGLFSAQKTVVHDGIATLLRKIALNGYKILYIAQRGVTGNIGFGTSKAYLANIDNKLPPGPIFQSPESLIKGFGADRTDLFKAASLRGLKSLFPANHTPYSACFCTRAPDTVVFSRYGVLDGRIFIVSDGGEVRNINHTFRRTFSELGDSVDIMFPTLPEVANATSECSCATSPPANENSVVDDSYNDFLFWRPQPQLILN